MSKLKTRPFDMANYLHSEEEIAEYLRQVLEGARYRAIARKPLQKPLGRARAQLGHLVQSHPCDGLQAFAGATSARLRQQLTSPLADAA